MYPTVVFYQRIAYFEWLMSVLPTVMKWAYAVKVCKGKRAVVLFAVTQFLQFSVAFPTKLGKRHMTCILIVKPDLFIFDVKSDQIIFGTRTAYHMEFTTENKLDKFRFYGTNRKLQLLRQDLYFRIFFHFCLATCSGHWSHFFFHLLGVFKRRRSNPD